MALWRKDTLKSLVLADETPWQFDVNGSKRSQVSAHRFLSVTKRRLGIDYVFTAIVNGYWSEKAFQYAQKEQIEILFEKLPKKTLYRQWFDHFRSFTHRIKRKYFR